jgi:pantoate--beta-alanine ligase
MAPRIHAVLEQMRERVNGGESITQAEREASKQLEGAGFVIDYVAIRRAEDLAEPATDERKGLVALVAARLCNTRLIDNLPFD